MNAATIKDLIKTHGAKAIVAIGFDNDKSVYYVNEDILSDRVLTTMGDEEFIKTPSLIQNEKTGKYDIPVTVYKPLANIQSVIVLDNPEDRDKIKVRDLYML